MASELLYPKPERFTKREPDAPRVFADPPMRKDSLIRVSAVVLALLTATTIVFAAINFQKEGQFVTPDDGVWWMEHGDSLVVKRLTPGGPAERAGIKVGDKLLNVSEEKESLVGRPLAEKRRLKPADKELLKQPKIKSMAALQRQLYRAGVWSKVSYDVERDGAAVEGLSLVLAPVDRSLYAGERLIALIYLGIGIYVLFRRWTAPKSTHFYIFCLVSFVLYSFHYTGKLNTFDQIIYWSNVVAWLLQPALFLHFALTFPPEDRRPVVKWPWLAGPVYLPGALLLAAQLLFPVWFGPSEALRWVLDWMQMFYLALYLSWLPRCCGTAIAKPPPRCNSSR